MNRSARAGFLNDLLRLCDRLLGGGSVGPVLSPLKDVLDGARAAGDEDFDSWLAWTHAPSLAPPEPALPTGPALAACRAALLALRVGRLAALSPQRRADLGMAAVLAGLGAERLGKERLAGPAGSLISGEVLRLVQCLGERLDGKGPMGLGAAELDPSALLLNAVLAYEDGIRARPEGGHRALAAVLSDAAGFGVETGRRLQEALAEFPLGSAVRLSSGETGRVVGVRPSDPKRPLVAVRLAADGSLVDPPVLCPLAEETGLAIAGPCEDPSGAFLAPWGQAVGRRDLLARLTGTLLSDVRARLPAFEDALRRQEKALRSQELATLEDLKRRGLAELEAGRKDARSAADELAELKKAAKARLKRLSEGIRARLERRAAVMARTEAGLRRRISRASRAMRDIEAARRELFARTAAGEASAGLDDEVFAACRLDWSAGRGDFLRKRAELLERLRSLDAEVEKAARERRAMEERRAAAETAQRQEARRLKDSFARELAELKAKAPLAALESSLARRQDELRRARAGHQEALAKSSSGKAREAPRVARLRELSRSMARQQAQWQEELSRGAAELEAKSALVERLRAEAAQAEAEAVLIKGKGERRRRRNVRRMERVRRRRAAAADGLWRRIKTAEEALASIHAAVERIKSAPVERPAESDPASAPSLLKAWEDGRVRFMDARDALAGRARELDAAASEVRRTCLKAAARRLELEEAYRTEGARLKEELAKALAAMEAETPLESLRKRLSEALAELRAAAGLHRKQLAASRVPEAEDPGTVRVRRAQENLRSAERSWQAALEAGEAALASKKALLKDLEAQALEGGAEVSRLTRKIDRLKKEGPGRIEAMRRRRRSTLEDLRRRIEGVEGGLRAVQASAEKFSAASGERAPAPSLLSPSLLTRAWEEGRARFRAVQKGLSEEAAALDARLSDARRMGLMAARQRVALEQAYGEEVRRLKASFAAACREVAAQLPIVKLRRELEARQAGLKAAREALRKAREERAALRAVCDPAAERLARSEAALRRQQEAWIVERSRLEAEVASKRRELHEVREKVLELSQGKDRLLEERKAELKRLEGEIAARLRGLWKLRQARLKSLKEEAAALDRERDAAGAGLASARKRVDEEAAALAERIALIRGRAGEVQGLLAARSEDAGRLKAGLQTALSDLDVKLGEAHAALEAVERETSALKTGGQSLSEWEAAASSLDVLADEYLSLTKEAEPLLERWPNLSALGLHSMAAALRQELLDRGAELASWNARVAEIDERLSAARKPLTAQLALAAFMAGVRAYHRGDYEEARSRLSKAVSLDPNPEARGLLAELESLVREEAGA
ncbi:MAG: hypothetical protein HY924_08380 [Elusimicrobia bacterium]|nr:hypothetical protein [Elusimicrobiota bacterium]